MVVKLIPGSILLPSGDPTIFKRLGVLCWISAYGSRQGKESEWKGSMGYFMSQLVGQPEF